ncbi:unnamed protein product [Cyclocybe aegerita]|uniref:CENP-V/GFA domain-containing protein n=1 Tax=Cyclocybe aegerita TaxID=1973307 RepID=A0A8S0XWW1_CYCAE|nr:unnamed protein product [Cyclocybe aegerita]
MSFTYVKATCHCGKNVFQIPFETSKLPLASDLCHCNSCRHVTGTMGVHTAHMKGRPLTADSGPESQKPADLSNLSQYNVSSSLTRHFCSTCSAYMLYETTHEDGPSTFSVSTGSLERVEGIVKVGYHAFLGDTLDGGMADHYRVLDGVEIPRYEGEEGGPTLPLGWKAESISKKTDTSAELDDEKLAAYCHCKTISFYLTRATQEAAKDEATFWLVPAKDDDPTSRPRFMSGHCFCTSCRLSSGSTIRSHSIVPRENIIDPRTSLPISLATESKRPEGLKKYESSPGTYREFCGTCGASVFYCPSAQGKGHGSVDTDGEPSVVGIGVGLLDENDSGARAERWCFWSENLFHPEDAIDKAGLEAVKEAVKTAGSVSA